MAKRTAILILILSAWLAGCSNQWREANPERTPEEVNQFLADVQSAQGQGLSSGNVTAALQHVNEAQLYFADSESNIGMVSSLLSFDWFGWMGNGAENLSWGNISETRIFFLDYWNGSYSEVGLVIGINQGQGYTYYGFHGTGDSYDGEFVAELQGGAGTIVARSYDTTDDILDDVIQLKLYLVGPGGGEQYLGKISTLVLY